MWESGTVLPHLVSVTSLSLTSFYKWENRGTETSSTLLIKFSLSGKARIQIQAVWFQSHTINHCVVFQIIENRKQRNDDQCSRTEKVLPYVPRVWSTHKSAYHPWSHPQPCIWKKWRPWKAGVRSSSKKKKNLKTVKGLLSASTAGNYSPFLSTPRPETWYCKIFPWRKQAWYTLNRTVISSWYA